QWHPRPKRMPRPPPDLRAPRRVRLPASLRKLPILRTNRERLRATREEGIAMDIRKKLEILADAAKYDASCASSGASKRESVGSKGIGSTEGMGICHSYTPDGRCVSLLKILLTNACVFDCLYCINRS